MRRFILHAMLNKQLPVSLLLHSQQPNMLVQWLLRDTNYIVAVGPTRAKICRSWRHR